MLKWCHQFGSITGVKTCDLITTATISRPGIAKNKLNKICNETECDNKYTRVKRVPKTETQLILESIDLGSVLSNSPDEHTHKRMRTIKCNKFGSRGDKREEEKASRGRGRE